MNNTTATQTHSQIFALVAALILAAVLASGCSTQAPSDYTGRQTSASAGYTSSIDYTNLANHNGTTTSSAATSYVSCVNVMTQYGLQQQCYQVQNPYVASYNSYTSSIIGFAGGVSKANLQQAYVSYLAAVDADGAADMKAQYDAIIAAYTK